MHTTTSNRLGWLSEGSNPIIGLISTNFGERKLGTFSKKKKKEDCAGDVPRKLMAVFDYGPSSARLLYSRGITLSKQPDATRMLNNLFRLKL
jgi:hypothetical protein